MPGAADGHEALCLGELASVPVARGPLRLESGNPNRTGKWKRAVSPPKPEGPQGTSYGGGSRILLGAWGSWELPVVSGAAVIWGPVSPMQGLQAGARDVGIILWEFLCLYAFGFKGKIPNLCPLKLVSGSKNKQGGRVAVIRVLIIC